jgi:hypothetical protein
MQLARAGNLLGVRHPTEKGLGPRCLGVSAHALTSLAMSHMMGENSPGGSGATIAGEASGFAAPREQCSCELSLEPNR